ncbi:hypothetical protein [Kineococcus sp. SYSU DK005]|uniref:hypothetical protein n=1 Tax=Kineococcus sp. SYSU DK005 TaxID=3383126 RepID=UPI003D7C3D11
MPSALRTTVALAMSAPVLLLSSGHAATGTTAFGEPTPSEASTSVASVTSALAAQQHIPADCYTSSLYNHVAGAPGVPDLDAAQDELAQLARTREQALPVSFTDGAHGGDDDASGTGAGTGAGGEGGEGGDERAMRVAQAAEVAALKILSAPGAHRWSQHGLLHLSVHNEHGQLLAQADYHPAGYHPAGHGEPSTEPAGYLMGTLTYAAGGVLTGGQGCTTAGS